MPKNTVSDPITDQEMAFAHLVLSGTMNDRRAAEAVGLNPDTAAYTKSKPRVRAYMIEHRAAVEQKLVNQEAEGLRNLNLGRDQILTRLWALANLSPEATRNNIAGQIKAMAMIVAIEGLIPDRRLATPANKPPVPPFNPNVYRAPWVYGQQPEAEANLPVEAEAAAEALPGPPQATVPETPPEAASKLANHPPSPVLDRSQPGPLNPFIHPERMNWVPDAIGSIFHAVPDADGRLPFSPIRGFARRRR